MKSFFTLLCFLVIIGCASSKKNGSKSQGIEGYIREVKGNQMPSPGIKLPEPKGLSATLYIYELTNVNQTQRIGTSPFYDNIQTKFVDSVASDSSGHFVVALSPGSYSLFTKVKGKFYANNFDTGNNIMPVKVERNKYTKVEFLISAGAVY
jgi:hypothetical protein